MPDRRSWGLVGLFLLGTAWSWAADPPSEPVLQVHKADGYSGIWYFNQLQNDEYVYKYSGGLGTYCAQHRPFAIYSKEANKTFFCYGGTDPEQKTLWHMVSYYDHATGMVPRPTFLLDKKTSDAHDNPVIALDAQGYIWIFSSSHGTARPSYLSVSKKPYDIDDFELVWTTNFSYPQPHYLPGQGFAFLCTRYDQGRRFLGLMTSPDGRDWSDWLPYARIEKGHYQASEACGTRIGTAMDFHPDPQGLNWRTNLYYLETDDLGKSWHTVDGRPLETPLTTVDNPALIHDYRSEKRNVYVQDLTYDAEGRPVILYLTSNGWESGPKSEPHLWQTARWTGSAWDLQGTIPMDNNYDVGSLYIEPDGQWRLIGPSEPGPQRYNTGGEIAMWTSRDQGKTWTKVKQLTEGSEYNHGYCRRPVDAHPDFYAFWADGHARQKSESRLYFTNQAGDHVWRLPVQMTEEFAKPELIQ